MVKGGDEPEIELVRDGFSWGDLVFQLLWSLYRRLWWVSLGLVALAVALALLQAAIGDATWIAAVNVAEAVALGWYACDLRRWELTRKGFRAVDIVRARRLGEAEELAIARWAERDAAAAPISRESELV
jgi:hypothetical protein